MISKKINIGIIQGRLLKLKKIFYKNFQQTGKRVLYSIQARIQIY